MELTLLVGIIIVIGIAFILISGFKKKADAITQEVPYKVEKTEMDNSTAAIIALAPETAKFLAEPAPVTEAKPAKKPRAPRKPKAETAKKPAAKKTTRKPKAQTKR